MAVAASDGPPAGLERRLGHAFRDATLLRVALTHRSASARNNERLEFLGDAVLNLVVAEALYARHAGTAEGDLSRMRASLVNADVLAELGRELGLGELLVLGGGELKSGGFRRDSILADAVEALVGAVYLDAGFEAARGLVERLYRARIDALPDPEHLKDPKTRLQEHLQKRGLPLPDYAVIETRGADHEQTFRVRCTVTQPELATEAEGRSRRAAEQAAARAALDRLTDGTP